MNTQRMNVEQLWAASLLPKNRGFVSVNLQGLRNLVLSEKLWSICAPNKRSLGLEAIRWITQHPPHNIPYAYTQHSQHKSSPHQTMEYVVSQASRHIDAARFYRLIRPENVGKPGLVNAPKVRRHTTDTWPPGPRSLQWPSGLLSHAQERYEMKV
jgi:hypothetical protein